MKLFIIRHGQSTNNLLGETATAYDDYMAKRDPEPPLTEVGHRQAELLAEHLISNTHAERKQEGRTGYGLTQIYCSPMWRTLQTALPVSQATGIKPKVWVDIHEQGGIFQGNPRNGEIRSFPGLTRAEILSQFPGYEVPDTITDTGWWTAGHEEMSGCQTRAQQVAETLRSWAPDMPDERIALISHGTFAETLIRALLGLPADHRAYFSHYNTAITRIDFLSDGYVIVRYTNRVEHLPPELITR
jgi:2,3-bisphosphoglycerate-dependent phosphoglycerate mutase